MRSVALGSAAICGVEFGGVYLDYMWPLNYFEQQHCLLSQEKVSIDPRFTPASSEVQQRKHEAEQDTLPTEQQVSGSSSTAAESSSSHG